jgi:soluble lytic murein transglycosylase
VAIDRALELSFLKDPREPRRLLVRYQQARLWAPIDPPKSCALWMELQSHPKFPLQRLARLRAMEVCPIDRGGFSPLSEIVGAESEPWLQVELRQAALARAHRSGDKLWEMKLSLELARTEKLQRDKIRKLQRAYTLASELQDNATAEQALQELRNVAPRFLTEPEPSMWMDVATDLRQVREFQKARDWYKKIQDSVDHGDVEKLRALDGIRMTHKLEKNTPAFLKATRDYADFARTRFFVPAGRNPSQSRALLSHYFQTRLALARAIWTEGDSQGAERILRRLEKDMRGRIAGIAGGAGATGIPIEESLLIRARIAEEAGLFEKTVQVLNTIDLDSVSNLEMRGKILWLRAWNLRKLKRFDDAIATFEMLRKEKSSDASPMRTRFWLARTLAVHGQHERAASEFNELIEEDPLGWYGLLAYRELKIPLPPLVAAGDRWPASIMAQESALMPEERLLIEWLIASGENEIARRFLEFTTVERRKAYSEGQLLDLLKWYPRVGGYQNLFTRLFELPGEARSRLIHADPNLLFPQPWTPTVTTAAQRFGVAPELIYAIMRQESSFNPTARSHADAFGLMQLIPEAAHTVAKSTGITLKHHDELFTPEVNVALGTALIRDLLKRWDGHFIPAVASYNASEKAIEGWLKTRYRGDALEFIEDIPYEETRTYVKLVTRNFIFYSRLNSKGSAIEFPEWCLAGLQDIKP